MEGEDQVHISNWYSSAANRIEQIELDNGKSLSANQVHNLVNAMASFGVAPGGAVNLNAEQKQQLDVVLAANWA